MPISEPTWAELPFLFKSAVVELLPYKNRCCLRKCSKSDQFLVDSTPNHLHDVAIHTCENYTVFTYSDSPDTVFTLKYFKNIGENDLKIEYSESPVLFVPGKNQKFIFKTSIHVENLASEADDVDFALDDFKLLLNRLNCKKSIINMIPNQYNPIAHPDRTIEFRQRLLDLMTSSFPKKSIKSKSLVIHWHQETQEIAEILQVFHTKTLKNLEFHDRNATWHMAPIIGTEQWKGARSVLLEHLSDVKIEELKDFNEIQMHVRDSGEQELWTVIQNFIRKNLHGSSFHFTYRQAEPNVDRILATFNVPPRDEPITARTRLRSVLGSRFIHTQRFQMPSTDLILVVMISEKEVMGTVCHVDQVNVEAKVERGLLR
ncbi:DUF38 domain-containing protein [Caenorhabditis elegans]|uniref:DUF38 domain-containing protein n=1 Tax=Caenorhabditis elegans TaxID=6239 RepID=Q9U1Z5_CAEEL|nr:DUF38 domain-containing protein [Caenorhabditis elegans]CAB60396.2 DUF38 domain-containing protein [Caenorhabditis elegans]|eukprot:NP_507862.2 Uncharacterized protein CELE_Y60A3A.8 [Caenorhabditis elegans]